MAVKLGDKVKDKLSGFEGVVTARNEYLVGPSETRFDVCVENATGARWFGEERIELAS